MTFFSFLIGGLATWRLSHAIVKENGPFMIFPRIRALAARHQKRSGGLFDMLSCVYCTSFWIALVVGLYHATDLFHWFGYALALSALATLTEMVLNKFDAFSVVTTPTTNNQISIGVGSTPKKRDDVVSDPDPSDGKTTVKTTTTLHD